MELKKSKINERGEGNREAESRRSHGGEACSDSRAEGLGCCLLNYSRVQSSINLPTDWRTSEEGRKGATASMLSKRRERAFAKKI